LLTLAEDVAEIKTICHCGRKATMNVRLDEKGSVVTEGNQIEIGGNDKYVAVCRRHFKKGRMTTILK
jgi:thymidine kinase